MRIRKTAQRGSGFTRKQGLLTNTPWLDGTPGHGLRGRGGYNENRKGVSMPCGNFPILSIIYTSTHLASACPFPFTGPMPTNCKQKLNQKKFEVDHPVPHLAT